MPSITHQRTARPSPPATRAAAAAPPALPLGYRAHPQLLDYMWSLSADERTAAAYRGEFPLVCLLAWASARPHEVPVVGGDWWFISLYTPDCDDDVVDAQAVTR